MRNFLAFLRRFQVLLVFAILQGVALSLYFTFLNFPRTQYLTTANAVSGSIYETQYNITQYLNLKKNNDWLQKENARLRSEANLHALQQEQILREHGATSFHDTINKQHYTYIPAQVIRSTHTKRNNYFTLNIGSDDEVARGDGVFSSNGVVGKVHNVSANFCVVKSCLTKDINIACLITSNNEHGILKWDGRDPLRGNMMGVSNDTKVKKWSKVITMGSAGIFPRGIPVGMVEKTEVIEGESLWNITLKFAENFRRVQRVYVIKNKTKAEQLELENTIPQDDE